MLTHLLMLTSLAAADETTSGRYASETVGLVFEDVYQVFSVFAFDTGYLPSINDPVSVRFHIPPTGGVVTEARAARHLEWDDAMEVLVVGEPGTGRLSVDSELEIEAEIHLDIPLIFTGAVPLWSEYVSLYQFAAFDPLALDGSTASVELSGTGLIDPFEYAINVIPAVLDVVLAVEVYPTLGAEVTGVRTESHSADGVAVQTLPMVPAILPPPAVPTASLEVDTDYVTELQSTLSLVIEPSATVNIFGALPITLLAFPIDVPLVDLLEERVLSAETASHPLPILDAPASLDAGGAEIGALVNLPVQLSNVGDLAVEGCATIVGSDDFTVFPDSLFIPPGGEDGLMVSFSPIVAGQRGVTLQLQTNDPARPVVEIPITADALDPEPSQTDEPEGPPGGADASVNAEEIRGGCGCDQSGGTWWWAALCAAVLAGRRTRRS